MNELSLFNSLFDDGLVFPTIWNKQSFTPKVDVKETKDSYVLDMDLPGRTEGDVDLSLKENVLTISSDKEDSREEKGKDGYLIRERTRSRFTRSFTLPDDVQGEAINATFKNGVLEVTMPRNKALAEPKKISIKSE